MSLPVPSSTTNKFALLEQRMSRPPITAPPPKTEPIVVDDSKPILIGSDGEESQDCTDLGQKRKNRRFTEEEDRKILEGVQKYGRVWETIVKNESLQRTPTAIRIRFKNLEKRGESDNGEDPEASQEPPKKRAKTDEEGSSSEAEGPMSPTVINTSSSSSRPSLSSSSSSIEPSRIQELTEALNQRTGQVQQLERMLKEKEMELSRRMAEFDASALSATKQSATHSELLNQITRMKSTIVSLVRTVAKHDRKLHYSRTLRNNIRLGTVSVSWKGNIPENVWVDGEDLQLLTEKMKDIETEKAAIETERKALGNAKKSAIAAAKLATGASSSDNLNQQEEVYRLRLAILKKDEMEVASQREKLRVEQSLHAKQLHLMRDESVSKFRDFPLLNGRYVLTNLLGRGGFSEVYKAFDLETLQEVACKIHQLNESWSPQRIENYRKHSLRECRIHSALNHPRVARLFEVFSINDTTFCTILELCEGGDLDLYLKTHTTLPEREAKIILSQIVSALRYLHSQAQPVIHYDLKPGNILFQKGEVRITDFGLAKIMSDSNTNEGMIELTSQGSGTYWYLPPECQRNPDTNMISPKVDVWSVGVIFYQMLYGTKPFGDGMTQERVYHNNVIHSGIQVTFPSKPQVSDEAKNFITNCLITDQTRRPDIERLAQDSYLTSVLPKPRRATGGAESSRDDSADV